VNRLEQWIETNRERLVEEWREACRIPSVSSDVVEATRMADWVERRLDGLFDVVRRVDVPGYAPALIATLNGESERRLLIYTHYDVQPAGDEDLWSSAPFEAELRDGSVVARGSCDDKADITARLQALECWLESLDGRPPYTIIWLCEGAEEIGSPGLKELLERNRDELRADWCLWESFIRGEDGRPEVAFGCRGVALLELSVRTMTGDQHAAFSPVFRSAAVELVHALASLVDDRGNVLVEGFEAGILPFSEAERAAGLTVSPPGRDVGVDGQSPHLPGLDERALANRLLYTPTINISAIGAGDVQTGTGIVTATARANVDVHLVPGQDPQEIVDLLRAHLDRHGYEHVQMNVRHLVPPAKSPIDTPLGRAAVEAARETMGDPVIYPLLPGAGPGRMVLDILGASTVSPGGTTRLASGIHAPDERGRVDDYLDHVRFSHQVLERLAEELQTNRLEEISQP
jgi:acetylornithine deacetylase/succinyl-diaminopimelate desuccinylase-like protein